MLDKWFYFVVSLQYQIKNTNKMNTQIEANQNFQQLIESVQENQSEILESIENYSEDIEELLYNNDIEDIAEVLGLTIIVDAYRYGLRDL